MKSIVIHQHENRKVAESKTHKVLKKMASKYPNNEFLKISLELTPNNYTFESELSNEVLLNDALAKKYGI